MHWLTSMAHVPMIPVLDVSVFEKCHLAEDSALNRDHLYQASTRTSNATFLSQLQHKNSKIEP